MGAIGVLMIVLGITMAPVVPSLGILPTTILFLLLSPAMLIAVYSLFFEQSKFYGILGCALIGVAVLIQPLAWYWAKCARGGRLCCLLFGDKSLSGALDTLD